MRRFAGLLAVVAAVGRRRVRARAGPADDGLIGPANKIQPSGRKLAPAGQAHARGQPPGRRRAHAERPLLLDAVGGPRAERRADRPGGAAGRCRKPAAGRERAADARLQAVPEAGPPARGPGRADRFRCRASAGGIAMAPDGRTAYVSGVAESPHLDQQPPPGTPGKEGDVIHVFRYDPRTGTGDARTGTIPRAAARSDAPIPQSFPPTNTGRSSWPRDLAVSPRRQDAARRAQPRRLRGDRRHDAARRRATCKVGSYPYGAAITRDGKYGLVSNESDGTVSVIDLAAARKVKDIQVGPAPVAPRGDRRSTRSRTAPTWRSRSRT